MPGAREPETGGATGEGRLSAVALRPILVLLAALLLAGCGSSDADVQTPAPSAKSAPDISGAGLDGEALSLADFRGKPVFVNVWSSW